MRLPDKLTDKKNMLVLYKLLHDTLFVLLLFFALSLVAEGVLPGIIASHFGMSKIIILVLGNIFLITLLGNHLAIQNVSQTTNKKMILAVSFLGILLVLNSLLKIGLLLNLLLTAASIIIAYVLYSTLFREDAR